MTKQNHGFFEAQSHLRANFRTRPNVGVCHLEFGLTHNRAQKRAAEKKAEIDAERAQDKRFTSDQDALYQACSDPPLKSG